MTHSFKEASYGRLVVLEGIDGVGKTRLAKLLVTRLKELGRSAIYLSFPDHESQGLGKLVYDFHHKEEGRTNPTVPPTSIQLIHVAAHIDSIANRILPELKRGTHVVLDRYWWSTWAYGIAAGIAPLTLKTMLNIEKEEWQDVRPSPLFLVTRKRESNTLKTERKLVAEYAQLAKLEAKNHAILRIRNNATLDQAVERMIKQLELSPKAIAHLHSRESKNKIHSKDLTVKNFQNPQIFTKLAPAKTTEVYDTYWKFAARRQKIFFDRLNGKKWPWTEDEILRDYKFTNAYRASDRVSQYLIRNVIYNGEKSPRELFFRILLFKVFNRIDTWELLQRELGVLVYSDYTFDRYNSILTAAMTRGERVYSPAYIMPSGGSKNLGLKKHSMHLKLIDQMIKDDLPDRLSEAKKMSEAFEMIRSYPTIGDFLAYQYITDINYSPLTSFSEMEFVVPGPGALGGIRKCFADLGGLNESEMIRVVTDRQEQELSDRGLDFKSLWGRPLQLIDCQNLFCETDKYARVRHPQFNGNGGRSRIKQKYKANVAPLQPWYPPKWGINDKIQPNSNVYEFQL